MSSNLFFKRLELHGFKSFGHKTRVEFLPGFTVVVGPNGCGKSNILDSIRWVLGETSAKSLRGGKMGDVVFRGSQSTRAAGLAQVTLTLDNGRGLLKLDQPEVSITRRLFATGESEYRINNVKCRMRDVHEILLDTGLGADGYSVIEQGQVGQMVSAKPSERRQLFEEAAGISRYKARREETLRKLKRTEEDLTRIQDIVSEVERQANSLRNQAAKARRYRRLKKRLRRMQQRLIVLRHASLSGFYKDTKQKFEDAKKAFEESAAAVARADTAVETLTKEVEVLQTQVTELQGKGYEVQTELEREKFRAQSAKQRIAQADERSTAIARELESHEARLATLSGTIEALELDLANEEADLQVKRAELEERTRELDALRGQASEAERERAKLRADLNDLTRKRSLLESDKRLAENLIERLAADLETQEKTYEEAKQRADTSEEEFTGLMNRANAIRERLENLRAERKVIAERISQEDASQQRLNSVLEAMSAELSRTASRLHALKELEENYEGLFRGVKEVMKASDRNELRGIIGVVSSLVVVPEHLEIAMEVALGGSLQDIVVQTYDEAKRAIGFLKQRNFGRATFLPLDFVQTDFNESHLQRIWGRKGVLGLGRDLIEYDKRIEAAIRNLFKSTVIVDHIDIAAELQREGIRNRFVSLQGDVVNPGGALTGGSHQSKGLLSRSREIRDLQDKVKRGEEEIAQARQRYQEAKDRLGQLQAQAAALQSDLHNAEMDEARVQRDLQASERERKETRNRMATVEARLTQLRLDRQKQTEVIEESDLSTGQLNIRIEEAQRLVEEQEAAGSARQLDLQTLAEDVAVRREALAGQRQRTESLRERLKEIRRGIEESAADRLKREEERTALSEGKIEAEAEREAADYSIGNLARELEGIQQQIGELTALREEKVNRLRSDQLESQRLLRDRNERDNAVREAEVKVAELKAQLEYLDREAQEEFEMTVADIRKALEEEARAQQEAMAAADEARKNAYTVVPVDEQELPPEEDETEDGKDEPEISQSEEDTRREAAEMAEDDTFVAPADLRARVTDLREKLAKIGAVNEAAIEEYEEASQRLRFLVEQRDDLQQASDALKSTIESIDETTARLFREALEAIRTNFSEMFQNLFNGGKADLLLVEDEKHPEPGIDIFAQPPGKKIGGSIMLMSGGEKALTAIALMFALFHYKPSPICILDEIDAPLDDVNVMRMCKALKDFARDTQYLIITHNKISMQLADSIYGVTMQEPGVSKVVNVQFDEVEDAGLLDDKAG
ncbi:MAG: chromosome segregation protein SMC [Sumerlaeia bacterium]